MKAFPFGLPHRCPLEQMALSDGQAMECAHDRIEGDQGFVEQKDRMNERLPDVAEEVPSQRRRE